VSFTSLYDKKAGFEPLKELGVSKQTMNRSSINNASFEFWFKKSVLF